MTFDRRDPEYRTFCDDQKWRMDQLWLERKIGDTTYLRSLFFCGYDLDAANQQLQLLKQTKENGHEKVR